MWEAAPYRPTDCLNGIRVLSMVHIIMGHTLMMPLAISGYSNVEDMHVSPLDPDAMETGVWVEFLLGGELGVDTFFFIGGFLLSFIGIKRKTPVLQGMMLRFLRLTPSLAFVLMVYTLVVPFLASGPFAPRLQAQIFDNCRDTWWTELVYTMNFVPWNSDHVCMGWTWYLGNDMIFAVFGLVLLTVYKRSKLFGWILTLSLMLVSFAVTIYVVYQHKLGIYIFGADYSAYMYWLYSKPYSRIPVYLLGLIVPWVLDFADQRGLRRGTEPRSRSARMIVIAVCMAATALMVFCMWWIGLDFPGGSGSSKKADSWSGLANAVYITFSRPLWGLGLTIIAVACYFDYLPFFNGALSHWLWTPFTRLTYGAYLVHPLVVKLAAANETNYYTYSVADVLFRTGANAVLAYTGAAVVWCLVEKPMASLTGLLLPKSKPRPAKVPAEAAADNA